MNPTNETFRKFVHFALILIPIIYANLGKELSLKIFIPLTIIIVTTDYLRSKNPKIKNAVNKIFGLILKEHELKAEKLSGASFAALAACINFTFFKEEIAVTAFVILAICDSLAALVGKNVPSQPFFEKSRAGASAFFVSGFIVLFICGGIYDVKAWFYIFGIFSLFCVTVLESRPSFLNIDDNFVIPVAFSTILTFFSVMWG